ncbi:hypothetical protein M513_11010, partial [Trichuris suis]
MNNVKSHEKSLVAECSILYIFGNEIIRSSEHVHSIAINTLCKYFDCFCSQEHILLFQCKQFR